MIFFHLPNLYFAGLWDIRPTNMRPYLRSCRYCCSKETGFLIVPFRRIPLRHGSIVVYRKDSLTWLPPIPGIWIRSCPVHIFLV